MLTYGHGTVTVRSRYVCDSIYICFADTKSDTAIQRYSDTGTGTWNRNLEPEPGTVHNICKLEHFAPQEIYIIIIYRGGGAQFNDSIKYYMQGIFMFKLLTVTKQRMNIVVALHGKTCFVIARPFFLSVLI